MADIETKPRDSEGHLWPGADRSDASRESGTDLLKSVRRWEREDAPHSLPDWPHMRRARAAGKCMNDSTARFWTLWVLTLTMGRKPIINEESRTLVAVKMDLSRIMKRFRYDSAEGWAARIEWLFLPSSLGLPHVRSGAAEIARLIGRLDVLAERAAAREARVSAGKGKGGTGFKGSLPALCDDAFVRDADLRRKSVAALARHIAMHAKKDAPPWRTIAGYIAELGLHRRPKAQNAQGKSS